MVDAMRSHARGVGWPSGARRQPLADTRQTAHPGREIVASTIWACRSSGQDQMDVAELVPEVAALARRVVRAREEVGAGGGLEQHQVRGLGLVPAGEQA